MAMKKKKEPIDGITYEWLKNAITELDTETDDNGSKDDDKMFYKMVAMTAGGTPLYIVVGWSDGFDDAPPHTPYAYGTERICKMIAYNIGDFFDDCDMPYDIDGEGDVEDTNCEVHLSKKDVRHINSVAREVWNDWKDTLDRL
jgi:predicted mannosyl-3-phosphoglycerate phosphatase (HAD superfamily)